jgi:hypothetical protein
MLIIGIIIAFLSSSSTVIVFRRPLKVEYASTKILEVLAQLVSSACGQ